MTTIAVLAKTQMATNLRFVTVLTFTTEEEHGYES